MRKYLLRVMAHFLPVAVAIIVLSVMVFAIGQQILRQGANEPQIQIAEDTAALLYAGNSPQSVVPQETVEIDRSLETYMVIFDENGSPIVSSADLGGHVPAFPKGALDYAQTHGENRVTWQPEDGVRSAVVIVPYTAGPGSGYVLVGRSLREIEKQEDSLLRLASLGMVGSLSGVLVATIIADWLIIYETRR